MSSSPTGSPNLSSRPIASQRQMKRPRADVVGRPLALPRLLETLEVDALRGLLQSICSQHPSLGTEVENTAPRPTVPSAITVLKSYESKLQAAFPFGGDRSSDYAYNRVKQALLSLLDALADFTPQFLPPTEPQALKSLAFLDEATNMIHRLPNWNNFQNNIHKQNAYEEMAKAWALAIREAAKRAGGVQLQFQGWDEKVARHNQQAEGKLQAAVDELKISLGWMAEQSAPAQQSGRDEINSVRQELLSGTYGSNLPVQVGPW